MSCKFSARRAFTLIDSVTALLCLVMLAALAMPCLIQLRSRARLDACARQMREVCLAAHNYHDAYRRLPAATLGFAAVVDAERWSANDEYEHNWRTTQNTNSLLCLAPFMELNVHYDKIPPIAFDLNSRLAEFVNADGQVIYSWQGAIEGFPEVATEHIDKFYCPEDDLRDHQLPAIVATQPCQPIEQTAMDAIDACNDIAVQYWKEDYFDGEPHLGFTNYVACMGVYGESWTEDDAEKNRWRSAMSPRHRVTLMDITDGTSRTFMYGESLGEINDGERQSAMSWTWGGGARMSGLWPPDANEHPLLDLDSVLGNEQYASGVGFGSKHEGVIVFALCDGSCREINVDCDREVLFQLAGAHDGGDPSGEF